MKRSPCNSCREHKRRCSYDIPCERCQKHGLQCIYTTMNSPKDEEYIRHVELLSQIEQLYKQLDNAEDTLLRLNQPQSIMSPESLDDDDKDIRPTSIIKDKSMMAVLRQSKPEAKTAKPWELTISNGQLVIRTFIKTHQELLEYCDQMSSTLQLEQNMPRNVKTLFETKPVVALMQSLMWYRYGKLKLKHMVKDLPLANILPGIETPPSDLVIHARGGKQADITANEVLEAYMLCPQHRYLMIHVPTFRKMYTFRATQSAPAMALCAATCTLLCRHIAHIIGREDLLVCAQSYFDRARSLVEDDFDSINLSTCATFAFLAIYKARILELDEAKRYNDMTERMLPLIHPNDGGEEQMLHRLFHTTQMVQIMLSLEQFNKLPKKFDTPMNLKIQVTYGDTDTERRHIHLWHAMVGLKATIYEASHMTHSDDLGSFLGTFSHVIETAVRMWYEQLPDEFKLSLPLFDNVSDKAFANALERDCKDDDLPILVALKLYNEYVVIANLYLPKYPRGDDATIPDMDCEKFLAKRADKFRANIGFLGSDDDYQRLVLEAIQPGRVSFDFPLVHTAVSAALMMVRMLQNLQARASCHFQHRMVVNAFDILSRAARFRYQQPKSKEKTLEQVQSAMMVCLNMLQQEAHDMPAEIKSLVTMTRFMEKEIKSTPGIVSKDINSVPGIVSN